MGLENAFLVFAEKDHCDVTGWIRLETLAPIHILPPTYPVSIIRLRLRSLCEAVSWTLEEDAILIRMDATLVEPPVGYFFFTPLVAGLFEAIFASIAATQSCLWDDCAAM